MEQLNKIELRGVVGSIRTQSFAQNTVARLTLVTNFAYKDKEGSAVIDTSWHNIVAWDNKFMPDFATITKGSKLYVTGRIRYQKYTGVDGVERISTEVVANKMVVIDGSEPLSYEM